MDIIEKYTYVASLVEKFEKLDLVFQQIIDERIEELQSDEVGFPINWNDFNSSYKNTVIQYIKNRRHHINYTSVVCSILISMAYKSNDIEHHLVGNSPRKIYNVEIKQVINNWGDKLETELFNRMEYYFKNFTPLYSTLVTNRSNIMKLMILESL